MSSSQLILASTSPVRRTLLENAGVTFSAVASDADEPVIRQAYLADNEDPVFSDMALILAAAKAELVSEKHPGATVIGADQLLVFEGSIVNKAENMDEARSRLLRMRGKAHALQTAVCCIRDGGMIWSHTDAAHLTMRDFSPQFLGRHLADVGDQVLTSVGCYQFERQGIQLFDRIEGSYFTILGLPMLPLLAFLRDQGLVAG